MKTEQEYIQFIKLIEAEAFKRGQEDIAQKIMAIISPPKQSVAHTINSLAPSQENPFRIGTDSAAIYEYIKNNPGLRGSEIIKGIRFTTKTVRTALHRMKSKHKVAENRGGKWFVR